MHSIIYSSNKRADNNRKKQALCIASVASNLDNFNRSNVDILQELGYEVTLSANFHSREDINSQEKINAFAKEMRAKGVHLVHIDFARSIKKIGMQIKSILQVRKLLKRNFELIHCHSPICAAIVRAAAEPYRKKYGTKVFYTAHGFHFFTGAPFKNWLIYYPVEKWMSRYTDVLITINKEDYRRAKKNFKAGKTVYIPGVGVDTEKFRPREIGIETKRAELGVEEEDILLLSVGELSERKNHRGVIEALSILQNSRIHYFIAGMGKLEYAYADLVKELGLEKNVHFLGYRTDISDLCQAADIYIFPSKQEGLPMALMEAIATKTPVLFGRIRGNIDLVKDESCFFNPDDANSIADCLNRKVGNNNRQEIRCSFLPIINNNYKKLLKYDLNEIKFEMNELFKQYGGVLMGLEYLITRRELHDRYGLGYEGLMILSVGELNANKNHELAIRAFAKMKMLEKLKDAHYFICGIGNLQQHLKNIISELNVDDCVHLLGFRDDTPRIYRAADVFVFPSKREGLPMALMEAMASGLVCIVSDIRGNRDLIQNNSEGIIVYGNSDVDEKAIEKCFNIEERKQIGRNAYLSVLSYSQNKVMEKMRKVYRSV